jgi:hypothetical protein
VHCRITANTDRRAFLVTNKNTAVYLSKQPFNADTNLAYLSGISVRAALSPAAADLQITA